MRSHKQRPQSTAWLPTSARSDGRFLLTSLQQWQRPLGPIHSPPPFPSPKATTAQSSLFQIPRIWLCLETTSSFVWLAFKYLLNEWSPGAHVLRRLPLGLEVYPERSVYFQPAPSPGCVVCMPFIHSCSLVKGVCFWLLLLQTLSVPILLYRAHA